MTAPIKIEAKWEQDGANFRVWLEDVVTGREVPTDEVRRLFAEFGIVGVAVQRRASVPEQSNAGRMLPYFGKLVEITDDACYVEDSIDTRCAVPREAFLAIYSLD